MPEFFRRGDFTVSVEAFAFPSPCTGFGSKITVGINNTLCQRSQGCTVPLFDHQWTHKHNNGHCQFYKYKVHHDIYDVVEAADFVFTVQEHIKRITK